jgi:general L-amino acid transport system permease protein
MPLATATPRATPRRSPRPHASAIIVTAIVAVGVAWIAWRVADWAIVHAVWTVPPGDSSPCRAMKGRGACWAMIGERARFILLGTYPVREHWRPALVCLSFTALYAATVVPAWWTVWLLGAWFAVPAAALALLRGGWLGLALVPSDVWGGLPLTFVFSTVGFVAAIPLGAALALGRQSRLPVIRSLSTAYIELVRGVPLVTFLFMAAVMFPLFVPAGFAADALVRAQVAFAIVIAAYLAEVFRGGLQAVPRGQYEAAASVGLTFWPATMLVVAPQALRAAIPALVNTFVTFFKDTSLVAVIGLFDLLGTAKAVIVDPEWVGFGVEAYLFAAAIYFAVCGAVSVAGGRLERALAVQSGR